MKGKLTGFRYGDKSFEIEFKFGLFEKNKEIDTQNTIDNILKLHCNAPTDLREPIGGAEILIGDDRSRFKVLVRVKDDFEGAIDAESIVILIGVCVVFK